MKLQLLHSILLPSVHYGSELFWLLWLKKALSDLEQIYSKYLRHLCGVNYATPSAMLLEKVEPVTYYRSFGGNLI